VLTAGASGGPLIGRDSVLSVFDQRLDALQAGRGSAVLLVGEPGLGKTRLLEELTVRARRRGLVSAWGRSSEGGSGEPYGPWRWVLRSFGLSVTAGASREAWVADVLNALAVAAQSNRWWSALTICNGPTRDRCGCCTPP
jgi:predicted ATPase